MTATIVQFPKKRRPAIKRKNSTISPRPPNPETVAWHRAFGQRLCRTREILGISEAEAAAAFLTTIRTYRRWEAGLRFYKGHEGFFSFSQKYNVTLKWLYGFSGAAPPVRPLKLVAVNGKSVRA
jgi:hypothetical protein